MHRAISVEVLCLALLLLVCARLHAGGPKTNGNTASEAAPTTGSLTLHAQLLDSADQPLAGWSIYLSDRTDNFLLSTETVADGSFDVGTSAAGPFSLIVFCEAGGAKGPRQYQNYCFASFSRSQAPARICPLRLDNGARMISGRVVTRGKGLPVAGASVSIGDAQRHVHGKPPPPEQGCALNGLYFRSITDAEGRFTLAGFPGNAMLATTPYGLVLEVAASGIAPYSISLDEHEGIPNDLGTIAVTPGATITGRLVDSQTRQPLKADPRDLTVSCLTSARDNEGVRCSVELDSATLGRFTVREVPPETLEVSIRSPHLQPKTVSDLRLSSGPLDLGDVPVTRWPRGDAIVGHAIDGATGKPFADGAEVCFPWAGRKADVYHGVFHIYDLQGIPARPVLTVNKHAPVTIDPLPSADESGSVDLGDIEFPIGVTLTGVVSDSKGAPVPQTFVYANLSTATWGWSTQSDADAEGRFSLTGFVEGGSYVVHAAAAEKKLVITGPAVVNLVLPGRIPSPGATFRGRLVDLFGHGLSAWIIYNGKEVTDAEGRFTLDDIPEKGEPISFRQTVRGSNSEDSPSYIEFQTVPLRPAEGERQVVLPYGATIKGRLLYADGDRVPSASYQLKLQGHTQVRAAETTAGWTEAEIRGTLETDSSGTFRIGPFPAAVVRLDIVGPSCSDKTIEWLPIGDAPETSVEDLVVEPRAVVQGRFLNAASGNRLAVGDLSLEGVECLREDGTSCGYGRTIYCRATHFAVGQIPLQTRTLIFTVDGFAPCLLAAPALAAERPADLGTVELTQGVTLRVRLTEPSTGKPYTIPHEHYENLRVRGRLDGMAVPYERVCNGYAAPPLPLVFRDLPPDLKDAAIYNENRLLVHIGALPKPQPGGIVDLGTIDVLETKEAPQAGAK